MSKLVYLRMDELDPSGQTSNGKLLYHTSQLKIARIDRRQLISEWMRSDLRTCFEFGANKWLILG
jgi:hypothetical protein